MATFDTKPDYLLQTKLYPPRVPALAVERRALLTRLNQQNSALVTLVSAPAGYGKSTLVSQWLFASGVPFAWLSLDEYDRRLDIFVRYVVAAIQTAIPDFGRETLNLLELARLPSPERMADALLFDQQGVTETFFLVLDDYHTITEEAIHRLLIRLLQHIPQTLRLVIISRTDPPLAMTRLRGRGILRELRGSDLRFSAVEAASGLETLLHHARGEQELAQQVLEEAVLLGRPGGALREFVDLGSALIPYLKTLRDQGTAAAYLERILAAYPGRERREPAGPPLKSTAVSLLTDLTNHEMDVLLLLANRLTNKEIAAELQISPLTVKKHTINLYQKLEVANRRQAVVRAREAGII